MQSKLLSKKVLGSILALGALTVSSTALANSGGDFNLRGDYVGLYPNGSNVVIDEKIEAAAYGSYADNGILSNNTVTVSAGCMGVAGAEIVEKGDTVNNSVIIEAGANISTSASGAKIKEGNATGNSVIMNGGTVGRVYGAKVETGNASGNSVVINGGKISNNFGSIGQIVGASVYEGDAVNNYVEISDKDFQDALVHGALVSNGNAEGNMVVINNGTFSNGMHGAFINVKGNAEGNTVIINGGSIISGVVYGAAIDSGAEGNVKGNGVILNDGSVKSGSLYGAFTANGIAEGNYVVINNVQPNSYFDVYGAYADLGDALNNSVVINGCKVAGAVYGGRTGEGNAEGNTVIINGGSISGSIYGGGAEQGDTQNNYVVINDGNASGWIFGGHTAKGNALNNQVNINGGKITGTVYGGYADEGKAKGNVITISGDADLSEATLIAGAEGNNSGKLLLSENTAGENTIRLNGWSGSVAGISGTDVIEINGSKLTDNGILHITGEGNTNLSGTTVKVNSIAGGQNLTTDSEIEIITAEDKTDLSGIKTEVTENGILAGVTGIANGEITTDADGNVIFKVSDVQLQKQTAITTETRAAAAAMVNQGSEVIADSISKLQYEDAGVSTFATISGNNSKYKTGSYVDINGWNGIVGAAKTVAAGSGKLSYGAFFENGSGNYNTYNDFNGNILRGDGNAVYNGGGLLMRYAKENGVYTEASVRAGLAKNEVSHALAETSGQAHGFKTENAYYGAHIGIGKLIKLEKGKAWDIYGKYFYTHHEGDSVTIANDNFDFDAIDSSRLRLGARFSEQQSHKLSSYYGLAWDYEFSGEAGGTAAGHSLYAPSLEGSTVIGELGFRYTPDKAGGWYFDASVKGYAGQQEGLSGSVQVVYSF